TTHGSARIRRQVATSLAASPGRQRRSEGCDYSDSCSGSIGYLIGAGNRDVDGLMAAGEGDHAAATPRHEKRLQLHPGHDLLGGGTKALPILAHAHAKSLF